MSLLLSIEIFSVAYPKATASLLSTICVSSFSIPGSEFLGETEQHLQWPGVQSHSHALCKDDSALWTAMCTLLSLPLTPPTTTKRF